MEAAGGLDAGGFFFTDEFRLAQSENSLYTTVSRMRRLALPIAVVVALTAGARGRGDGRKRAAAERGAAAADAALARAVGPRFHCARGLRPTSEFAGTEDETPTLNVLTAGGTPEEPNRRDLELAMDKVRQRVEECHSLEQFVGPCRSAW